MEFRYRLLADEYLRQKSKKTHVVGRQEVLAYYESHLPDYSYPEKVHWQLLEISFAKHGGQAKSLAVLEQAIDALRRGENFAKVAKKYSDGPHAENGGQQSWTKPDSVADTKTAAILHKLAPGEVSPVVHTADSYRLIRLNARKPAGRHALAEVQETIERKSRNACRRRRRSKSWSKCTSRRASNRRFCLRKNWGRRQILPVLRLQLEMEAIL